VLFIFILQWTSSPPLAFRMAGIGDFRLILEISIVDAH
jgi:hypothetical protein